MGSPLGGPSEWVVCRKWGRRAPPQLGGLSSGLGGASGVSGAAQPLLAVPAARGHGGVPSGTCRSGSGLGLGRGRLLQGLEGVEFALEVAWILEVLVDAGEAHVGDGVQVTKGVEHLDADLLALDFPLTASPG